MPKRTVLGHRVSAESWQHLHDHNEQDSAPIHLQHLSAKERWGAIVGLLGRRVNAAQIDQTAAAMAYYAILSIFPAALIVFNLVSRVGVSSFGLRTTVTQVVPKNVMATIAPVLQSLAAKPSTTWVGIGTIFTLWAASLCIASMRSGFNRAYGIRATVQNFFVSRLVSMMLTVILIGVVIAVVLVFTFGRQVLEWVVQHTKIADSWVGTFQSLKWPITIAVLLVAFVLCYYFIPNAKMRFWTILPGATFTTAGWLVVSYAFALYMHYFGSGFSAYGTLAAFVILLLWLFINSFIVMVGAVINACIYEYFYGHIHGSKGRVHDFARKRLRWWPFGRHHDHK